MKVLFAEDDEVIRKIVENCLHHEDYDVIYFPTGEGVFEGIKENKPDLVLLDNFMPVKNGLEILSEMKNDPETASTPVVILTCSKERDSVVKALSLGAKDYIVKPFSKTDFVERINSILNKGI